MSLLPATTLSQVKLPELLMPPPFEVLLKPPVMVTPEIFTVVPELMEKTGDALFPLTVKFEAPGPLIVRLVLMVSTPVVSVMVAGWARLKLIVSPDAALAIQPAATRSRCHSCS